MLRNSAARFLPKTILLCLLLISSTTSHKVTESTEDIPPEHFNTTTLYPIANRTSTEQKQKADNSWKIETTFAEPKLQSEDNNTTDSKEKLILEKPEANSSREFKPSPHLGDFFDLDSLQATPTKETFEPFTPVIKKPPTGFISSTKTKFPKDIFKTHHPFPYKFESAILTRAKDSWHPTGAMESKPTAEVPVRVPAGSLYELPEVFKEKPSSSGDDEEFGLEFAGNVKENPLKKRVNPWPKLLQLMSALIPVGLIISALTPNLVTIENVDNQLAGPILRRVGSGLSAIPPISERCRRRLLCELHSQYNYFTPAHVASGRVSRCHRLHCEDPAALAHALSSVLAYHRPLNDDSDLLTLNT